MAKFTAIYKYAYKNFSTDELIYHTARCFIVGSTTKSYKIKLIDAISRRCSGDEIWVKRSSIIKRGYYDIESSNCVIHEIRVVKDNCLACLRDDCLTKNNFVKKCIKKK